MGFSRQEYWSGLPFPTPEHLPDLGIETASPEFTTEPPGKPQKLMGITLIIPLGLFNKVTQTQYCKAVFLLLVLLPGLWVSGMVLLVSAVAPLILVGSQV